MGDLYKYTDIWSMLFLVTVPCYQDCYFIVYYSCPFDTKYRSSISSKDNSLMFLLFRMFISVSPNVCSRHYPPRQESTCDTSYGARLLRPTSTAAERELTPCWPAHHSLVFFFIVLSVSGHRKIIGRQLWCTSWRAPPLPIMNNAKPHSRWFVSY